MSTLWGNPTGETNVADGIDWVMTGRHGGLRVKSRVAREAGIVDRLKELRDMGQRRRKRTRFGPYFQSRHWWFEKEHSWSLAVLLLPQFFSEEQQEAARDTAKAYYPEGFTLITGEEIPKED